jgi:hypothetical protein
MKPLSLIITLSLVIGMGVTGFLVVSSSHKIDSTDITEINCLERFNLNSWDMRYEFNIENKFNPNCLASGGEPYLHKELIYPHETKQESPNYILFINNHEINNTRILFVDDYSEPSRIVHIIFFKNQIEKITNSSNLHFVIIHESTKGI